MRLIRLIALALIVSSAAACGDDEPTTPTQPTQRPEITKEFAGTLTVNGGQTHDFTTTGSGQITVTVSELTPNSEAKIGVSLGTWNVVTTSCQIVIARDDATQAAVVLGNAGGAGNYCVRVYDAGQLRESTAYKLTVVHF